MKLTQLLEAPFQDYVPTKEELDQEIADTKAALAHAQRSSKAPLVLKYQKRLDQLQQKLKQIK